MDLAQCLALTSSAAGGSITVDAPSVAEIEALLDFTRAVAHASERKAAPLAAYAFGVATADLQVAARIVALRRATALIDEAAASSEPG